MTDAESSCGGQADDHGLALGDGNLAAFGLVHVLANLKHQNLIHNQCPMYGCPSCLST